MFDLLILCPEEVEDPWIRRLLTKCPKDCRLSSMPEPKDLELKKVVLEAFSEKDEKEKVLLALGKNKKWSGPVASLSTYDSTTIVASKSELVERLVGFQPSLGSRGGLAIELLKGERTSTETVHRVQEIFHGLGCMVFVCRDQAGGILPRVLASVINEAAYMAWTGIAPIEKIDAMMRLGANFPMGPFQWADQIGIDRVLALLEAMHKEFGPQYQPCPWIRRKVESGKFGVRTGEGFYNYGRGDES